MSCKFLAETITVGQRGTIVIPSEMRRELGIEPGTTLLAMVEDGSLTMKVVADDPIERLARAITEAYGDTKPEIALRELREEWPD
ncbi:MAG: AbrB/MazE/SpoVT family DNA-binding domain-containing protein [Dehalococcoidia bacterium]